MGIQFTPTFYLPLCSLALLTLLQQMQKQKVSILPLGAGCEVGRSCLILTINQKKIMLDCGLMINKEDSDSLPLFDKIDPQEIEMIIITHAHLDHCGALPYFLAKYDYKGKVFMTRPTKDIYQYLVRDTAKVQKEKALFNNQQIQDSMERICSVQFGVQAEEEGVKFTPYVAGHIVGAAMFIIQIDGVRVLYTGDYSCQEDRYIMKAEIPQENVDILISESTFGTRVHESRRSREQSFQEYVHKIIKRGGKCLLPVFSAGRAQELLFILDQYWQQKQEELQKIPIYYTVSLIDKCRQIYQTYIDMLSKKIRERFYKEEANPFKYRYIHYLKKNTSIYAKENDPMVVMCTPGMLQNGQSRTLLERWCHDSKNGVCITGYCAQGSIASNLKRGDCINSMDKDKAPIQVNLSVQQISFAAHADCQQTTQFIKSVNPNHVVLVHGSGKNAQSLRQYISQTFPQIQSVSCPKNQEELPFQIQISENYHVAGQLKQKVEQIQTKKAEHKQQFEGYIVNTGNMRVLVEQKEKNNFFPHLKGLQLLQKIHVNYVGGMTLAHLFAEKLFRQTALFIEDGKEVLVIKREIKMTITETGKRALVEFVSSKKNDIIADQFCFLLSNIHFDPLLSPQEQPKLSQEEAYKRNLMSSIIKAEYEESVVTESLIIVRKNGPDLATVNLDSKTVDCQDQYMRMRLLGILDQYMGSYEDMMDQDEEEQEEEEEPPQKMMAQIQEMDVQE